MSSPNEKIENSQDKPSDFNKGLASLFAKTDIFSQENLGISEKKIEKLYARGKHLYESGKYKESKEIFSLLNVLSPGTPPFLYGLASASLMLKEIDNAIDAFLRYGALVPNDPMPYYYLSLCYENRNDLTSALIASQVAVVRSADQQKFQTLKHRSELAIANLTQKINEQAKAKEEARKS